jgi:spermidine/putrescine transport system substrate-binding protein
MTDRITRKTFLRRAAASGSILTVPGLLAACGGGGGGGGGGGTTSNQLAKTLHFSNWTLYMDTNKKNHTFPSLIAFQKKTGVHVAYTEDINDNASFYHKIQPLLARGESTGRDIVVLTDNDRYLGLMLEKGYAEKLDKSAIPNMKNLIPVQRHPSFDPHRDYTLPWQSGMTGLAYNDKLTDPVLSVDDLLENPKLKGKITVLNDMGDALTLVMLSNGDDPATVTDASFNRAIKKIEKAVNSGQVRQFYGNDYSGALAKGDLAATMAWSGDIVQLQADNKHLKWNLPKDGGDIWTDNMLIPKKGNVFTASTYMNFVYDPKIAALIADYVNYICPVIGAKEQLLKIDPAVAKNTLIFPTKEMLDNVHIIDSKALNNQKYQETWQNLISG